MPEQLVDAPVMYAVGLVHASVCAHRDTEPAEVLAAVNRSHPTGLGHGWAFSHEAAFASGAPNPGPCETEQRRVHYLLVC